MKPTPSHPYPRPGVATFVMKNDEFLMCFRLGSHQPNTWGLPGGKLDIGESFEECALREIAEEVGIQVANLRYLATTNDLFESEQIHGVTIFMIADWISGSPQVLEPDKCREWRWFKYDDMPPNLMLPLIDLRKAFPDLRLT